MPKEYNPIEKGRLVYIDPNEFAETINTNDGVPRTGNNVSWNMEDLQYSVDLKVLIPSRSDCGQVDLTKASTYNDNNKLVGRFVSFNDGEYLGDNPKHNFLTTSYTNISYQDFSSRGSGVKEALGVDSIDINFDSHFFPIVTVKFTDVRAASLMSPQEALELTNAEIQQANINGESVKNVQAASGSFFKALFHFPYPRFILTVKGFYGTKVSLILAVNDFKSSFNSQSGNFDVTVSFVGYMYGLYTDLPMNLVMCAPYLNKDKWDEYCEDKYAFVNNDGTTTNGCTFIEFIEKVAEAYQNISNNGFDELSEEEQESISKYGEINKRIDELTELKGFFVDFINYIEGKKIPSDFIEGNNYFVVLTNAENDTSIKFDGNKANKVKELYEQYKSNYPDTILNLTAQTNFNTDVQKNIFYNNESTSDAELTTFDASLYNILKNDTIEVNKTAIKTIEKYVNDDKLFDIIKNKKDKDYANRRFSLVKYNEFLDAIGKETKTISDSITANMSNYNKAIAEAFSNALGFRCNLLNIYRMIFAHISFFIENFNNLNKEIKDSNRTSNGMSLTSSNSDMPLESQKQNATTFDTFVPPFFAYFENDSKTGDRTLKYPGESDVQAIRECNECKFITDFIDAIENGGNKLKEAIDMLNSTKEEIESKLNKTDDDKVYINGFVPSAFSDVFYKGKNPYDELNKEGLTYKEFLYFIFARLYNISTYRKNVDETVINNELENFKKANIIIDEIFLRNLKEHNKYSDVVNYLDGNKNKLTITDNPEKPYVYCNKILDNTDTGNTLMYEDAHYEGIKFLLFDSNESFISNEDFLQEFGNTLIKDKKIEHYRGYSECYKYYIDKHNQTYLKKQKEGYADGIYSKINKEDDVKTLFADSKSGNLGKYSFDELNICGRDSSDYLGNYLQSLLYNKDTKKSIKDRINNSFFNKQDNDDDKAFLLLATIFSAYNMQEIEHLYNINGIMSVPKIFLLYMGAIFFQKSKHSNGNSIKGSDDTIPESEIENFDLETRWSVVQPDGEFFEKYDDGSFDNTFKNFAGAGEHPYYHYYKRKIIDYYEKWRDDTEKGYPYLIRILQTDDIKNFAYNKLFSIAYYMQNSEQNIALKNLFLERVCCLHIKEKYINSEVSNDNVFKNNYSSLLNKIIDYYDTNKNTVKEIEKNESLETLQRQKDKVMFKYSFYYTLKNLYDKWLCSYTKNAFDLTNASDYVNEVKNIYEQKTPSKKEKNEFNSFVFVNSVYKDISRDFLVNPETIIECIKKYMSYNMKFNNSSSFEFMAEIAEKNNLLFLGLPIFNNFYEKEGFLEIFKPNTSYTKYINGYDNTYYGNTYVILYPGEVSNKCGEDDYQDDILDIAEIAVNNKVDGSDFITGNFTNESEGDNGEITYRIPTFAVTFGKQNQNYFKNINVNMDNPKVTDYSIANLLMISQNGKHGDSNYNYGIGQNIYNIYSNRSYTCTVEMMGCMNIMPMMYFQLNNIPMFRGAYMIINVSHSIKAGDITTKFTGVRVSKNQIKNCELTFNIDGLENIVSKAAEDSLENIVSKAAEDSANKNNTQTTAYIGYSGDKWENVVSDMGKWYQNNVHTYLSNSKKGDAKRPRKSYICRLSSSLTQNDTMKVYDDCSSFVTACLLLYAYRRTNKDIFNQYRNNAYTSSQFSKNGAASGLLTSLGFTHSSIIGSEMERGNYSGQGMSEFDIVSVFENNGQHHVEILWELASNKKGRSMAWGSVHDGINGMPCSTAYERYTNRWRLGSDNT